MDKYDIVIIGAGPAGLTAGIYALRSGCSVCLIEKAMVGGQVAVSSSVENYPGMPKMMGAEWGEVTRKQVEELDGVFVYDEVNSVNPKECYVQLYSKQIQYKALIIATGAKPRKLDVEGEEQFVGKGVSYCAICDGGFFKGKNAIVVGGGDSAFEDAGYLINICQSVQVLVRSDKIRAQQILFDAVDKSQVAKILRNTQVVSINGDTKVTSVTINSNGVKQELPTDAVFVAVGRVPDSECVAGIVNMDNIGYIVTDEQMRTNISNIFAVGDVRHKEIRQIVTACSDGAIAATYASKLAKELKEN